MTYRPGRSQDRNVYRDVPGSEADEFIGVMFDPADAALVVDALNRTEQQSEVDWDQMWPAPTPPPWEIIWKDRNGHVYSIPDSPEPPEFVPGFVILTQPNRSKAAHPAADVSSMNWHLMRRSTA